MSEDNVIPMIKPETIVELTAEAVAALPRGTPQEREKRAFQKSQIIEAILEENWAFVTSVLANPPEGTPGGPVAAIDDWEPIRTMVDKAVALSRAQYAP